jgi:hypothetical protein
MRSDFDQLAAMRIEFAGGDVDFAARSNRCFEQSLARVFVDDFEPRKMREKRGRRIAGVDAEAVPFIESPPISPQVRNMVAASVVKIHGQQDTVVAGADFQHKLFLSLYFHDAVGVAEDIGAEPQLEPSFELVTR